jgi:hypothetical protein
MWQILIAGFAERSVSKGIAAPLCPSELSASNVNDDHGFCQVRLAASIGLYPEDSAQAQEIGKSELVGLYKDPVHHGQHRKPRKWTALPQCLNLAGSGVLGK